MRRELTAAVYLVALLSAGTGRASAACPDGSQSRIVPQDDVATARALAQGGRRGEALSRLEARLAINPGDLDARTLYGTVLSWEDRFDEARRELTRVLAVEGTHGDALAALARVELWSGHDAESEVLAGRVLAAYPDDAGLLLVRATALHRLGRAADALPLLDRALVLDPSVKAAQNLRRAIVQTRRDWQTGVVHGHDRFDGARDPWNESGAFVGHDFPSGHTEVTLWRASRFGRLDEQIEVEVYRTIRPGRSVYLHGGMSLAGTLYPEVKWGAEYTGTIRAGLEGSAGYRYLGFGNGANIFVGSIGQYTGDWLFTTQVFLVPDAEGPSRTVSMGFRRYFDARQWIGLRLTQGVDWDDPRQIEAITAQSARGLAVEWVGLVQRDWVYTLRTSWEHRERATGVAMDHWSSQIRLARRF